jgi:hypothetical protein
MQIKTPYLILNSYYKTVKPNLYKSLMIAHQNKYIKQISLFKLKEIGKIV